MESSALKLLKCWELHTVSLLWVRKMCISDISCSKKAERMSKTNLALDLPARQQQMKTLKQWKKLCWKIVESPSEKLQKMLAYRFPVRQMCRPKSCVPVRCAGTSYASASARDSILSAQPAGAHRTDYVATMSKTIMNSRFGRLSYLCRTFVAAKNLYVSIWDLHSARPLSQLSNDPALCRSHTGT